MYLLDRGTFNFVLRLTITILLIVHLQPPPMSRVKGQLEMAAETEVHRLHNSEVQHNKIHRRCCPSQVDAITFEAKSPRINYNAKSSSKEGELRRVLIEFCQWLRPLTSSAWSKPKDTRMLSNHNTQNIDTSHGSSVHFSPVWRDSAVGLT